jgi:hypothetical protein
VFDLRAHAHAGTRAGRQQDQFTVALDNRLLTVQLTAEIRGEFPPGAQPDFTPRPAPGPDREPVVPDHLKIWLVVVILALVFLVYLIVTSR